MFALFHSRLQTRIMPEEKLEQQPETGRRASDALEKPKTGTSHAVNASIVLLYAVFTGMFAAGWVSLNSCNVNRMIPVYLIVAGSTGILTKLLINTRNKYLFNLLVSLIIFDIAWLCYGSYEVYKEYLPNFDPRKGVYCNRTAYLIAFWMITVFYSLLGLFLLLSACYFLMRNTFRKT